VLATTGGYLGSRDFLQFIRDAEQGIVRKDCSKAGDRWRSSSSSCSAGSC
jgi:hypothetical protein